QWQKLRLREVLDGAPARAQEVARSELQRVRLRGDRRAGIDREDIAVDRAGRLGARGEQRDAREAILREETCAHLERLGGIGQRINALCTRPVATRTDRDPWRPQREGTALRPLYTEGIKLDVAAELERRLIRCGIECDLPACAANDRVVRHDPGAAARTQAYVVADRELSAEGRSRERRGERERDRSTVLVGRRESR